MINRYHDSNDPTPQAQISKLTGLAVDVGRLLITALLSADKLKLSDSEAAEDIPINVGNGMTVPTAVIVMINPVPI